MTQWTDKHYDFTYALTAKNIEQGSIKLDPYFVAKQWKVGSKDDSGALFHCLKTIARFGDKNDVEREVKALHAQVLGVARSFGVELEKTKPQNEVKVWCDTCEGVGHYDNTDLSVPREYRNTKCPCPDCDGKGYNLSQTAQIILGLKDTTLKFEEGLWYPDDSGKWVETSSIDFEVAKELLQGRRLEMLVKYERAGKHYVKSVKTFDYWDNFHTSWGNRVAYKVVE